MTFCPYTVSSKSWTYVTYIVTYHRMAYILSLAHLAHSLCTHSQCLLAEKFTIFSTVRSVEIPNTLLTVQWILFLTLNCFFCFGHPFSVLRTIVWSLDVLLGYFFPSDWRPKMSARPKHFDRWAVGQAALRKKKPQVMGLLKAAGREPLRGFSQKNIGCQALSQHVTSSVTACHN